MEILLLPVSVLAIVLFVIAFTVEIVKDVIQARVALDNLRERRHRREMQAADKQIALAKAQYPGLGESADGTPAPGTPDLPFAQ